MRRSHNRGLADLGRLALLLSLGACGGEGQLQATPLSVFWTEVNFVGWPDDMPEGGYEPQVVTLTNLSKGRMDITIDGFDEDHLCVSGYSGSSIKLPGLAAGQTLQVPIGVCGYIVENGERGSLVRGTVHFQGNADADAADVSFQFTPVVEQPTDDTGL